MKKQHNISPRKTRFGNTHPKYHRTAPYFSVLIITFASMLVFRGSDNSIFQRSDHNNTVMAEVSAIHDQETGQHKFFTVGEDISDALDPEYDIKRVCVGNGIFAAVVKFDSQYYVLTSKTPLRSSYSIISLQGLKFGGQRDMEYFGNNSKKIMQVRVLSRFQYKYSGFEGARSVCRQITQR